MRGTVPLLIALVWMGACTSGQRSAQDAGKPTRADSVAMASSAFDSAAFDTITWKTDSAALDRGNLVYRISCALCHGATGQGDAGFVIRGDTLRPPSFLAADWRFANDPMGLRKYIFTGNVEGMPYWGLVGLKYRDLDAVSRYITGFLRVQYKPAG
jgi:mono/diheme cytochrome c family protein